MQKDIIRSEKFFQGLILTKFYQKQRATQALIFLIVGHLYGLFNPNQLADALSTPKSSLYQNLGEWSLPQWKRLQVLISCEQAAEKIHQIEEMSESTKSRRKITLSVDDSVIGRDGKCLSYCYSFFSGRVHKVIKGQNILAITIKIGADVLPLCVRLVPKQGRANTNNMSKKQWPAEEVLSLYKSQWKVEGDIKAFKGPFAVSQMYLELPRRICAMMFVITLALQLYTLINREIANSLEERDKPLVGLMPNNIQSWRPQANFLLEAFKNIQLCSIELGDRTEIYVTSLNDLQKEILSLLSVPLYLYSKKAIIQHVYESGIRMKGG